MTLRRAALAIVFCMTSASAQAHTVVAGVGGFAGGLLHPLLVPAHVLVLLTLGLIAGQQSAAHRRILIPLLPVALIAAVILIVRAAAFDSQNSLLALCAICGLLLALARPLPVIVPGALIAAGGVLLMLDSVPALISVQDTLVALTGTAFSALVLFILFVALSARLNQPWQQTGRRIVGSWAAASAILVLALRRVK